MPLKHLSNFWEILDISLINCEVSLTLIWSKDCVLTDLKTTAAVPAQGDNPARPAIAAQTGATFKIKNKNCMFQSLLYQLKMTTNY